MKLQLAQRASGVLKFHLTLESRKTVNMFCSLDAVIHLTFQNRRERPTE